MVGQRNIYTSAKLFIEQHGDNAEDVAMEKMLLLMEGDDAKGASVWMAIMCAVEDLMLKEQQKYLH